MMKQSLVGNFLTFTFKHLSHDRENNIDFEILPACSTITTKLKQLLMLSTVFKFQKVLLLSSDRSSRASESGKAVLCADVADEVST